MVSLRSALVQSLFCTRGLAYNLLGELRELAVYAELQLKKSAIKYRAHPIVKQTDTQSRQIVLDIDDILNDIAGPQGTEVNWTPRNPWPLMQCNAFKRLLYKTMAEFLRKAKIDVEKEFQWLVRYTEDIGRHRQRTRVIRPCMSRGTLVT